MDFEKLDREIEDILSRNHGTGTYAEIREQLIAKGYNQQELKYILGLVDEKLLTTLDTGGQSKISKRNMLIGGVLSISGLGVFLAGYFGQQTPKEVSYIALVLFALGYFIFRKGFRGRNSAN
ncbi:MAG: hypothetical protein DHS20C17_35670 [Cyclobacteriaceae bacterium]|nr:MAG: hypothetical protein DHS20C17_35670 [Cyclobacteriaceae bacterium]